MSLAGFKKQINKANQYVSEKMGSVEGTKMEEEFVEMEKKTDAIITLVNQLTAKTKEFLHPNPAIRAKIYMHMGAPAGSAYPQTEGLLGDVMLKAGHDLDPFNSEYASALLDVGSALIEVGESRNSMDSHVQENFLTPLHELESKELKELALNRKKLQGRRLDYDCKKRKGPKGSIEEVKMAQYKFDESKAVCKEQMSKLLNNEVEMIHQLSQLVCGLLEFHKRSADNLERVVLLLNKRVVGAKSGSKATVTTSKDETASGNEEASAKGMNPLADDSATVAEAKPCCRAKTEYKKQKDDELSFEEGQIIILVSKDDDGEWYEGTMDGKFGRFPSSTVEIIVDIPEDPETPTETKEEPEEEK